MACAFVADAVADLAAKICRPRGRVGHRARRPRRRPRLRAPPTATRRSSPVAGRRPGPRHLDADFELVQDTFRRFADDKIRPDRRAHPPRQRRHPRGHHLRPGRDGRLRPVDPRGVRRLQRGRRVRVHRHGRRHRGAVARLARRRRLADHPARDPHPRARRGRHRGAEARVAPAAGHRPRSWSRSRSPSPTSAPTSPASRSRADARPTAAGCINGVKTWCTFGARADVLMLLARTDPDRSKTHRGLSLFIVPEAARRGPRLRVRPGRGRRAGRRQDGGPPDRHDRLPRHALLRGRLRQLVRAGRQPDRRRGRPGPRLLLPDGRLRERPAADRGPRRRRDAGGLRGGPRSTPHDRIVFGQPIGDYQLTQAKLGRMAVRHPGRPASSPTTWPA